MKVRENNLRTKAGSPSGFTLVEVIISMAILTVVIQGVIFGYSSSSQRAEWNARSLAAQSLASQGAGQAPAARWDTRKWQQTTGPGTADELGVTNYTRTEVLDIPTSGQPIMVTNYVSITTVSVNPPIRQIRSECVWKFM